LPSVKKITFKSLKSKDVTAYKDKDIGSKYAKSNIMRDTLNQRRSLCEQKRKVIKNAVKRNVFIKKGRGGRVNVNKLRKERKC
jgi:hypothetical protein